MKRGKTDTWRKVKRVGGPRKQGGRTSGLVF